MGGDNQDAASADDATQPPDVGPGGTAPIGPDGGGEGESDATGPTLPPKQEAAIVALLNQPTVKQAAVACGVPERTLYRWLDEPAFGNAYRKARRAAFAHATSLSQRYAAMAVNVLATVMNDAKTPWSSRVAAAVAILRFGRESIELDDLAQRVEALEAGAAGSAAARSPLRLAGRAVNLRAKIARLEARIPTGPAAEPGLIGRLMRRLGDLHTYEELMDMSGRAFDECMAAAASGEPAPTAAESARTLRGMIAQAEERWKSEGRELPEYAWVDRQAWGVR